MPFNIRLNVSILATQWRLNHFNAIFLSHFYPPILRVVYSFCVVLEAMLKGPFLCYFPILYVIQMSTCVVRELLVIVMTYTSTGQTVSSLLRLPAQPWWFWRFIAVLDYYNNNNEQESNQRQTIEFLLMSLRVVTTSLIISLAFLISVAVRFPHSEAA